MGDNPDRKSFLGRQWEAYKLVDNTVQNKSLLQDFIASDPVNGPIVKATQDTRGYAHFATGIVICGTSLSYVWKHRRRLSSYNVARMVALVALPTLTSRFALDCGISGYLLDNKDKRDAYVKFNQWLQERARGESAPLDA